MTKAPPAGQGSTSAAAAAGAEDVRLARIHLRLGELTLARAELEALWRRDLLDTSGLALLGEARWRTGDGAGAAEAASAHLVAGGTDDVALCIAAEAAALDGRQDEARDLMDRLPASDTAALDALFAGMPRRASWPAGPPDRSDLDDLRRDAGDRARGTTRRGGPLRPAGPGRGGAGASAQPYRQVDLGLQEQADREAGASASLPPEGARPRRGKGQLDPAAELLHARGELDRDPDRAFLRLALVLRHDPTRAPMVLEILRMRREPGAALLRGDAQRLLGRHLEAEAAFDAAADSLEDS